MSPSGLIACLCHCNCKVEPLEVLENCDGHQRNDEKVNTHSVQVLSVHWRCTARDTGALYALQCAQPLGLKLHLFGFNWNNGHGDTHSIRDEERVFREAEKQGHIVIHPTGDHQPALP